MVLKSNGPDVGRREDVPSVKDDAVAHDVRQLLQVRIRVFAPFRGDDQHFRIPGAFVHVFLQRNAQRFQDWGGGVHGLGVRGGDDGSFPAELFTQLEGDGFPDVVRVLLEGQAPDGYFFILEHPQAVPDLVQEVDVLGVIDMFHFLQQGEGNAQRAADVDEGFDVLREAGAPVAQSRVEEVAGDSLVHADAFRHQFHVRSRFFADLGDGVDVGNFQGQEGVGGVLDELRRVDVRFQNGRVDGLVDALDDVHGTFRVGADDDAVGMQQVVHRASLPQEFRVGNDVELHVRSCIALDGLADFFTGFDGYGGFVHNDLVAHFRLEHLGDFPGHFFNVGEVHGAVRIGRRGHGNEDDFTFRNGISNGGGKFQASHGHVFFTSSSSLGS